MVVVISGADVEILEADLAISPVTIVDAENITEAQRKLRKYKDEIGSD